MICVVLAAGEGKRLKVAVPKPLVEVKGKSMIGRIIEKIRDIPQISRTVVVINPDFYEEFALELDSTIKLVFQEKPLGTADALAKALDLVPVQDSVLVMYADLILISTDSLKSIIELHSKEKCDITFLSGVSQRKYPYALIERDSENRVISFQERKIPDFSPPWEYCLGPIILKKEIVTEYTSKLIPNPETGEIYISDIVSIAITDNKSICAFRTDNQEEFLGVNTPEDLKNAEIILEE